MKFGGKGHQILFYLVTEIFHIFFAVAVTIHAVIAQLNVVIIAQHMRLFGSVFHHLIVNFINLVCYGLEKFTDSLPCFPANFAVGTGLEFLHHGQVISFSFKRNLGTGNNLIITADQGIFLLHQRNQLFIKSFQHNFHIFESNLTDFAFHIVSVRGCKQNLGVFIFIILKNRHHFIVKMLFFFVKFIGCVNIMANAGNGAVGVDICF